MMLATLLLSGILGAGGPAATKGAADTAQAEMPKAPGEDNVPAGSEDLEKDLKKEKAPAAGGDQEPGRLKPGEKRETRDWADEERWGRYKKGQASEEEEPPPAKEAGPRRHHARPEETPGPQFPSVLRYRSAGGAFALGALVGVVLARVLGRGRREIHQARISPHPADPIIASPAIAGR